MNDIEFRQCIAKYAAEIISLAPNTRMLCPKCNRDFAINRSPNEPSIVCPFCDAGLSLPVINRLMAMLHYLRSQAHTATPDEPKAEKATEQVRDSPPGLADVIGNAPAVLQVQTALDAHKARVIAAKAENRPAPTFPHVIFSGAGGVGKTMLSEIIAREVKRPMRLQMGQSLNNPARVADVLLSLKPFDVLFIDEMHGLKPQCQETLYRAMEDGVLVPVVKVGSPVTPPIQLPPFTLIGSTTDEWGLLPSLLQRFKYRIRLERLTAAELAGALAQRAKRRGWVLDDAAAMMIGERAHGTPRLAIGLLDGCMDVALAGGDSTIDRFLVERTCEIWRIDKLGLDAVARKYLTFLAAANGEPVRLNVLASKLDGLSRRSVETRIEPDLVWLGLIEKGADGRRITAAGKTHLK